MNKHTTHSVLLNLPTPMLDKEQVGTQMIRFQKNPVIMGRMLYRVFTGRTATPSSNPEIGSRAIDFYKLVGFEVFSEVEHDDVHRHVIQTEVKLFPGAQLFKFKNQTISTFGV